jgi:hypothetical protein
MGVLPIMKNQFWTPTSLTMQAALVQPRIVEHISSCGRFGDVLELDRFNNM